MQFKEFLRRIIYWSVPAGIHGAWRRWKRYQRRRSILDAETRMVLRKNRVLENAHKGQRCFVLGTGPSINQLDLVPLRDELCISVNSFFLHQSYEEILPSYHVASGLAEHPHITRETGLRWYRRMEEVTRDAILILNYLDKELVEQNGVFGDRHIHYMHYRDEWRDLEKKGINASRLLYPSENVIVKAIQLALYMGCSELLLLGVDHDWFIRHAMQMETHFYDRSNGVIEQDAPRRNEVMDWRKEFNSNALLWKEYGLLQEYAMKRGVNIYNATPGGILDVFKRVDYRSLFEPRLKGTTD